MRYVTVNYTKSTKPQRPKRNGKKREKSTSTAGEFRRASAGDYSLDGYQQVRVTSLFKADKEKQSMRRRTPYTTPITGQSKASPNESEIHPSHKPAVYALCISPLQGADAYENLHQHTASFLRRRWFFRTGRDCRTAWSSCPKVDTENP